MGCLFQTAWNMVGDCLLLLQLNRSSICFHSLHSSVVWSSDVYLSVFKRSSVYHWGFLQCRSGKWHLRFHQFDTCPPLLKRYVTFSHCCYPWQQPCWKFFRRCGEKKTLNKVWHSLKLLLETLKQFREFGCVIFILSSSVQFLLYRLYLNVVASNIAIAGCGAALDCCLLNVLQTPASSWNLTFFPVIFLTL